MVLGINGAVMLKVSRRLIDATGMRDVIQRRIPVMSLDSGNPGPAVWLAGCIHGDEPGGAVIIHDVFKSVRKAGLSCGSLHALPLVNSTGFENVSRFINSDREDLNRCFPGNSKGTMGERVARRLFHLITKTKPDLVIDLHNDWIQSVPYVLIEPRDQFQTVKLRRETIRFAIATGLLIVQESEISEATSRTLTGSLLAARVPAFTVEAGGACGIVESSIAAGKRAVLGVLHELGMTDIDGYNEPERLTPSHVLDYTSRPHCTSSGIIRFSVNPGDVISANQELGRVYSAFGVVEETLRARRPGYVLGVSDHARAVPGSEVVAIAEFDAEYDRLQQSGTAADVS